MDKEAGKEVAEGREPRVWTTGGRPVKGREPVVKDTQGKIIRDDRRPEDKK